MTNNTCHKQNELPYLQTHQFSQDSPHEQQAWSRRHRHLPLCCIACTPRTYPRTIRRKHACTHACHFRRFPLCPSLKIFGFKRPGREAFTIATTTTTTMMLLLPFLSARFSKLPCLFVGWLCLFTSGTIGYDVPLKKAMPPKMDPKP